jgi:hypothetical protein
MFTKDEKRAAARTAAGTFTSPTPVPIRLFELRDSPQWFVAIFALTYITGFLIDTLYFSSIGIDDAGEIIKLRHIQRGLIFLMAFMIIVAPVYFLLFGHRQMAMLGKNVSELPPMKGIMAVISILYFGTIYYAVIFAPPGYFYIGKHPLRLTGFFLLIASVVAGYIVLTGVFARRRRKLLNNKTLTIEQKLAVDIGLQRSNDKAHSTFLYSMLFYIAIGDYLIFKEMIPDFLGMFFPYGIFFFLFCFLFSAQLFRITRRMALDGPYMTQFSKVGFVVLSALGLIILYYTAIAAFAYSIFPHIPNVRGGGNLSSAPIVSVFVNDSTVLKDPRFKGLDGQLTTFILVYSTSSSYYFVHACEKEDQRGPILQVKREEVKYLVIQRLAAMNKVGGCAPSTPSP